MSTTFDPTRPDQRKAIDLLESRTIAWLTWVGQDAAPHGVPVWFLWHDGRVVVFSEPGTAKVAAVRRGSPVLVHLETGAFGNEVVILNGSAEISDRDAASWLAEFRERYEWKYAAAIADFGMPLDDITTQYSAVVVFTPQTILTW